MATLSEEVNSLQEVPRQAVMPDEPDNLESVVLSKLSSFIKNIADYDQYYAEMLRPHEDSEETLRVFFSLVYTLKSLQSHFVLVQKIIKANSQDEIRLIKQEFNNIAKHYPKVGVKTDVTLYAINQGLDTVLKAIFSDLEAITNGFYHGKNCIKKLKKSKENIFRVKIITAKIECVIEYFPGLVILPKDDLFAQARNSVVWENMYKDVHFRDFVAKAKVQSSLSPYLHMLTVTYAMINKMETVREERNNKLFGQVMGLLSGPYYLAMKGQAKLQASLFYAKSNMDLAFKVWNMPEKQPVRNLWKMILPSIKCDKKIYVPRLFPAITKETILKEYNEGTLNQINNNSSIYAPDFTGKREEILETLFDKDDEKVQIRILSPYSLKIKKRPENKLNTASLNGSKKRHIENFDGAVIHIHGGGFVAMSSASHRNYLYHWAKSLNMVVFSIDYRLAPKDPYPAALDDVWQGYNWLVNYSEYVLGIPLDRIVLAGDSAGGNLVAAVTLRAIKEGVRIPNGCLMAYPALNLHPLKVVPSYFLSLEDVILPYSFLKLCVKAYVPEDCHPDSDPFLSPIVASDELLARFPPARIITGTGDPLHDDNWKLLYKLQNLNKNVKMTVYDGMPHGFLAMAPMAAWDLIIAESVGRMRELFYSRDEDGSGLKCADLGKRETSDTL